MSEDTKQAIVDPYRTPASMPDAMERFRRAGERLGRTFQRAGVTADEAAEAFRLYGRGGGKHPGAGAGK